MRVPAIRGSPPQTPGVDSIPEPSRARSCSTVVIICTEKWGGLLALLHPTCHDPLGNAQGDRAGPIVRARDRRAPPAPRAGLAVAREERLAASRAGEISDPGDRWVGCCLGGRRARLLNPDRDPGAVRLEDG